MLFTVRPAGQTFQHVQVVSDMAVCSSRCIFFPCYISADSKHLKKMFVKASGRAGVQ